jgi:hypothetical protein
MHRRAGIPPPEGLTHSHEWSRSAWPLQRAGLRLERVAGTTLRVGEHAVAGLVHLELHIHFSLRRTEEPDDPSFLRVMMINRCLQETG